ncbi:MAG: hypothetical protein IJ559_06125 [Prevotella sp.]|nr:hypothetical protein [Prevotella sp.]
MKRIISLLLVSCQVIVTTQAQLNHSTNNQRERLYQSFLTPPDSIRVGCYYYWINERVDPKGVVADQCVLNDGTIIRFTDDSRFEVAFPNGEKEIWDPLK